jgi:NTP pyrophosphatase (non-canonical NTP hydrolase)
MNAKDYHKLIADTAKGYDATDPIATDGSRIPAYSALGLAGESGEVVEMVKKALRTLAPLDKAKVALELGDCCWYVARMADILGFTFEDVLALNNTKLRRRLQAGKQEEAEIEIARIYFRAKEETT